MNSTAGLDVISTASRPTELPDDQVEWVRMMLTPDPEASLLRREKINSPTWLLVATFTFKILNKFDGGITQQKVQKMYQVRAKQIVACITGRKYFGGVDQKALTKMHKATDDEPEPSTSSGV